MLFQFEVIPAGPITTHPYKKRLSISLVGYRKVSQSLFFSRQNNPSLLSLSSQDRGFGVLIIFVASSPGPFLTDQHPLYAWSPRAGCSTPFRLLCAWRGVSIITSLDLLVTLCLNLHQLRDVSQV